MKSRTLSFQLARDTTYNLELRYEISEQVRSLLCFSSHLRTSAWHIDSRNQDS